MFNIRTESKDDFVKVYEIVKTAFANAEHRDGKEQDLVVALRTGSSFVPELSLVATINNTIVGHILFTKATVGNDTILVLAPLSVLPNYQSQGIGSLLIKEGHRRAKKLGYEYISVLGSEKYYPRFGYLQATTLGLSLPSGIPSKNFMLCKLISDAIPISGDISYANEFYKL